MHLARELNYRPVVFWDRQAITAKVNFESLFETAELPFELVEGFEAKVTIASMDDYKGVKLVGKMFFNLMRPIIQVQYGERIIRPVGGSIRDKPISAFPSRSFAVKSNSFFRYGCDLSWLKPVPQINSQIIELKKRFTPDTVGIHIRGTDKGAAFIEKIIKKMHAEVELNPDVKFFIASDGDKATEAVVTLFEDRLITSPISNTQRYTLGGQQGAIVDLFGLAATSRIIGFRNSSFATAAALIGNKPLLRIK